MENLEKLKQELADFAEERDWSQFHSPKNLSMALSVEASEIVEVFQWLDSGESYQMGDEKIAELREEIGDVFLYLLMLSDKFDIDPIQAAAEKLEINKKKYPAELSKGSSKKYNKL